MRHTITAFLVCVVFLRSDETHLHWFHASSMELDTEFELIGILIGEQAPHAAAPGCRLRELGYTWA
jgi:hypothetical protein